MLIVLAVSVLTVAGLVPAANAATNHNPFGRLDAAAFTNGSIRVSGWAIDPDTTHTVRVHVYINRAGYSLAANQSRPDIGRVYRSYGSGHGFSMTTPAASGTYNVCAFAMNVGAGRANTLLGCKSVTVNNNPFGSIGTSRIPGGVRVYGWVIDPNVTTPIDLAIGVESALYRVTARQPVAGLARNYAYYGIGHGFSVDVPVAGGNRHLWIRAANLGAGANSTIIDQMVPLAANPIGHLDSVSRTGPTTMRVSGWTLDWDSGVPTPIRITVDGAAYRTLTAGVARSDIARAFPFYGPSQGP